jgi:predicted nuclease of restriction endonuclease-like (RecB) superfamily
MQFSHFAQWSPRVRLSKRTDQTANREEAAMVKDASGKRIGSGGGGYDVVLAEVVNLLEEARRSAARSVNAIMTATYWEIGRRIVEYEQSGQDKAQYGKKLIEKLSRDLSGRYKRGFSQMNLLNMRAFYLNYRDVQIQQTASVELNPEIQQTLSKELEPEKVQTATAQLASDQSGSAAQKSETSSRKSGVQHVASRFPLSWSHYVTFVRRVKTEQARSFYEAEALRNGWTVRQLSRQIESQFYERTALSRNKEAMLGRGADQIDEDTLTPEEEIKDPFVLEFLDLKDEYSESDLEGALIGRLESFLLELGGDFTFVGRQRRLRIGNEWFRVDLLFFHRRLRCLVVIDLKLGKFTPAAVGQMHFYLNYARENWTNADENPPVGLILCAEKNSAVAHYALEGLPNKVLAAEYITALPAESTLAAEVDEVRKRFNRR